MLTMLTKLSCYKIFSIILIAVNLIGLSLSSSDVEFSCDGTLDTEPHYGSGGYKLHIEGSPPYYQPNRAYTVTLLSTGRQSFRAFHISVKSEENSESIGRFETYNNFTSQEQNQCRFSNMVNKHMGKKSYVRVKWLSPATRSGCILLKASVHEKGSRWYKDHPKLTTRICEKDINDTPTDECCACGTATYRMKFYGIWSPQTHPKDYPEYSTHWSNVVGASHTPEYSIWEYGKVSSDAVQQVAEWGFPEKLLHELQAQEEQDEVLSVVKTKAQWPAYPVNGRFIPLISNFRTDQQRFLVTLLTMLGPSPDWNVGISRESMCLSTCGWVGKREYFLTPWDAGTDDGVSYNSPNLPSNPRKPIRPLNSTDHPDSPFYDESGAPISPVARIVIERVQLEGEECGESEEVEILDDSEDVDVDDSDSNQGITGCMYSDWFDWMECSVSCGWGLKNRKRMLKAGKDMMCTDLMQTEICKGSEVCENNENVTTCIYSEWTSWTRCSASCGESVRSRQRVMKWPSEPAFCNAPLKELVQCQQPSCNEACLYSPWTGWMPCSSTCGVGTTFRKRGLKIGNPEVCVGMREESKCMTSMNCSPDSRFDVAECTYGPWMEWSACPVECGAGQTFRKRMLVDSSSPSARCDGFQMESSKCMTSLSCDNENLLHPACEWREWSNWTPCSVTCGMGIVMRQRSAFSLTEDVECSNQDVQKEVCNPTENCLPTCTYQQWNEWMPCSVSCGNGATIRKRFLDSTVDNHDECETFEMEKNRCMVPCQTMTSPITVITDCVSTPWGEWSTCSVTCGKAGIMTRTRNNPALSDCLETEQKKCGKLPKCPRDCVMGEWSEWRSCKKPCMKGNRKAKTYRRRKTLKKAKFGGQACGRKREVKACICAT